MGRKIYAKSFILLLAILIILSAFAGCSSNEKSGNLTVLPTVIPTSIVNISPEPIFSSEITNTATPSETDISATENVIALETLHLLCDQILLDNSIGLLGSPFVEVEQSLGKVSQVQFNVWGENRVFFTQSPGYRYYFGQIITPSEKWYSWTSDEFYHDLEWRQSYDEVMFEDNDACDFFEINITNVYPEWNDHPTVFTPSMIEISPSVGSSSLEEFLSWVELVEQSGKTDFEGMYYSEYEYEGFMFRFFWLNSDGSFSNKTWCMVVACK